ncbi:MAG: amino acid adenylation domain-containing protein, partial [Candidatus Aminicenantes bacterium]
MNFKEYSNKKEIAAVQNVKEKNYWLNQLAGGFPRSSFPSDHKRNAGKYHEESVPFTLTGELFLKLMGISKGSNHLLHMILTSGIMVLLHKYTGSMDIVLATPVYKQEIEGDFVNTVITLRNQLEDSMTFKELLIRLRQTLVEAIENQNYPVEILPQLLNLESTPEGFPLFDLAILLENIHNKRYLQHIHLNMIFSFLRTDTNIEGQLKYNSFLYDRTTIERISDHFIHLLQALLANMDQKIFDVGILLENEVRQLLIEFNNSKEEYARNKTILELFEEPIEKTPYSIATIGRGLALRPANAACHYQVQLTYKELNRQTNQLAFHLKGKGVRPGGIVGIMIERSLEMVIGILGILRAGGVYLPIDTEYPMERKRYMLADTAAKLLISQGSHSSENINECEIVNIEDIDLFNGDIGDLEIITRPTDLIYIIFTSGSTGKPKGSGVYHKGFLNLVSWYVKEFSINDRDTSLLLTSLSFDFTQKNIFAPLYVGGMLHIPMVNHYDPRAVLQEVWEKKLSWLSCTPSMFYQLIEEESEFPKIVSLRIIFLGGEPISMPMLIKWIESERCNAEVVNIYGPTECTDICAFYRIKQPERHLSDSVPIGKPVYNIKLFVLDRHLHLLPIGVPGELFIAGEGVGIGYINRIELTSEKFITLCFDGNSLQHLYRTGDLTKWLPEGNIEFLGRIDHQVKIRGHRIELGEIETRLLTYSGIREALVMDNQDDRGDKYLCAYIVSGNVPDLTGLRDYLSGGLPDYMIPSYFVSLEKIPLTPNGKIDRKALPKPELKGTGNYIAPRNEIERRLVQLWSTVLDIEEDIISIDSNFFQLGGHSLKATFLVAKMHKEFNVIVPLEEFFKAPRINMLARYLKRESRELYISVAAVEKKEYYPLSSAQKRLYILQQMELGSTAYNMPIFIFLEMDPHLSKLEETFKKLIKRHENFRTSFYMVKDEPVQRIHHDVEFEIEYNDIQVTGTLTHGDRCRWDDEGTSGLAPLLRNFIRPFDLSQAPLLHVALLTDGEGNRMLMVDMHHIISDGVSHEILEKDFTALYHGKTLTPLRIQYKDFSQWQNGWSNREKEFLMQQEAYWLREFEHRVPVLEIPTDYHRPVIQSFEGNTIDFHLEIKEAQALKKYALNENATLYMVLLAIFNVLLAKLSGQEDIVVGTPVAGRRHADLEQIIGMFVNTLLLRNYPEGEKSFARFLREVKEKTLAAFENQDYQFEELVERLDVKRDTGRNPLFDIMFALRGFEVEPLEKTSHEKIPPKEQHQYRYENKTSKFDMTLTAVEAGEILSFAFTYSTNLFKKEKIERFISYFKKITTAVLVNPGIILADLEIISAEEKSQILYDFNNTNQPYPGDKLLHQLLEERAANVPDRVAITGPGLCADETGKALVSITYCELHQKANQLARILRAKGITPGCIVGIMVDRSIEMVVGILSILKAGGAYLPTDPAYPESRKTFMLKDTGAKWLISRTGYTRGIDSEIIGIDIENNRLYKGNSRNLETINQPTDLLYTIFTSGSTGKPKGAGVYHRNFVNLMSWYVKEFSLGINDSVLLITSLSFDLTQKNIFAPLLVGGTLSFPSGSLFDPAVIRRNVWERKITWLNCTPGMSYRLVESEEDSQLMQLASLRYLFLGGEPISLRMFWQWIQSEYFNAEIVNTYGPTECTDVCAYYPIPSPLAMEEETVPIGMPVNNAQLFILDRHLQPLLIGIPGELFIGGEGVGTGYINRVEFTAEKFIITRFKGDSQVLRRLYRSGDLTKWLPDGNIEFLGRKDQQVKNRGFRVELGEIENQLLKIVGVKEALVIVFNGNPDGKVEEAGEAQVYLCAYVVTHLELNVSKLRESLSKELPDYMIPAYFVPLEQMPLNPNGKIDRKALPEPTASSGEKYAAPRNQKEIRMVEIWSEVLGIAKTAIGIDDNFFQLGGHSLGAVILAAKIHKAFNEKLPLVEIFGSPTIRALARLMPSFGKDRYTCIQVVEKKEYYTLSSAQKRLHILQQMELQSTAYNMPEVIPIEKTVDLHPDKLEKAFKKLINRHESLRTSFHMVNDHPVQIIHDEVEFKIEYYDISEVEVKVEEEERTLELAAPNSQRVTDTIKNFIRPFILSRAPLLRAGLIPTGDTGCLLLVDMHHIISDGVSHDILKQDFIALYWAEHLPPIRIQYKDFSQWQMSEQEKESLEQQEKYWLKEFAGDIPVLELPTDYPRPAFQGFAGHTVPFELGIKKTSSLKKYALEKGVTLYMVLLASFNVLLSKLSGQEDIVIGTPVLGRRHADLEKIIGMFVNTLALRNYPEAGKTFAEFLVEVKEKTLNAFENQEYPFEELVDRWAVSRDISRNPMFDIMFAMQNLEAEARPGDTREEIPAPAQNSYQYEDNTAKFDMTLTAVEVDEKLLFTFSYSTSLFKKEKIERFISYFKKIIGNILVNPGLKLSGLEILSEEEKQRILVEFNDTAGEFPRNKTLQELFEEQVKKTPHHMSVILNDSQITYDELNRQSNRLARLLREKGVKPGDIVGILLERSLEMLVTIIAVLKSAGAYVPLDPQYPAERIIYILADTGTRLLLSWRQLSGLLEFPGEILFLDERDEEEYDGDGNEKNGWNLELVNKPGDTAYIIYTSGSTGTPRGVMIQHGAVVNLAMGQKRHFQITGSERILQFSSISFDASVEQIFIALFSGAALVLIRKEDLLDEERFAAFLSRYSITHLHAVPSFLTGLHRRDSYPLKRVIAGGDVCPVSLARHWYQVCDFYNEYGPTETTVTSIQMLVNHLDDSMTQLPIGKPVTNTVLFILDRCQKPIPIGVPGELYIGGDGVARGYLNHVELTADKFKNNPFSDNKSERFYRTGDLACWLMSGDIEFLGRMDYQVKIRGYRIELGEIENRLIQWSEIKEAVVVVRKEKEDKYLCAYIVSEKELDTAELRDHLWKELPDYMIPSYFMVLESLPLTPTGKVDRKSLPHPVISTGSTYAAPRDRLEEKLVEIWLEILNRDALPAAIGIDDNFFRLGGHSLNATVMAAKIHKELNVKLPLAEVFKTPDIRRLAEYIRGSVKDTYAAIKPVEKKEFYVLSSAQKRLYILQQMEPTSIAYNMPQYIPLQDHHDIMKLEATFRKLINRHENFQTSFYMLADEPVQQVQGEVDFEIEYFGAEHKNESYAPYAMRYAGTINNFIRPFDLSQAPLLRVGLQKNRDGSPMLLVDMHHIISDGVSHEILVKDFMRYYVGEDLPSLRIYYKDFSQWQNSEREQEKIKSQEKYWLKEFAGEIPVLELPTDYPRPALQSFAGSSTSFEISAHESGMLTEIALAQGATMFMVLLAIFNILLSKLSRQEDIIVGTPIAGRRHADLEKIIGMFVNTLALRNFPVGEKTFREYLKEVKEKTLEAFENQEYQFEDLVEKVALSRDTSRNPMFDAMFTLQNIREDSGESPQARELEPSESGNESLAVEEQQYRYEDRTSKFDLTLIGAETNGRLVFTLEYCSKLFKPETITRFIEYFKMIVFSIIETPEKKISQIEIIPEHERKQLLFEFNDTAMEYLTEQTIQQLFKRQVEKTPDSIAVVYEEKALSFKQLEKKSNSLAQRLQAHGVGPDTITAIMVPPCPEMIVGLLGILKAGGAFLPVDPSYPRERVRFMLTDSASKLVVTVQDLSKDIKFAREIIYLSDEINRLPASDLLSFHSSTFLPLYPSSPSSLAYVIYTSGSTGKPKGVMIQHQSLVNLCFWHNRCFSVASTDRATKYAGFGFDASVWEIFPYLIMGASLYILNNEIKLNLEKLNDYIEKNHITIAFLPTQVCEQFLGLENRSLRILLTGGDKLSEYVPCHFHLVNNYGPTESTVVATTFTVEQDSHNIPIGHPISNTRLYILDCNEHLQPIGIPGELCIGGIGAARGYLNQPGLTAEKFRKDLIHNDRLYRTGDLARWLPEGNIEFLGRIDHQVKIRGYRIELGEIENCLLKHRKVKKVVLTREDNNGDKFLCAYMVCDEELSIPGLRQSLAEELPDYMIPSYFVPLEKIPLTPNGKLDRRALPKPQLKGGERYVAPRNEIERKLVELWSTVLVIEKDVISMESNFFQLGGHSLKAMILVSKIHKEFDVRVPLMEIFKAPRINALARYLKGKSRDLYMSIEPQEKKEYYPLSSAQKRLYILQQMEPASTAYHMPQFIPLPEEPNIMKLEAAFKKLIKRHESLRTSFHMVDEQPIQRVHDNVQFEIEYYDYQVTGASGRCRWKEKRSSLLEGTRGLAPLPVEPSAGNPQPASALISSFIRPFALSQAPLLRVGLTKTLQQEHFYFLMVDMHHIISDGVSHQLLLEDFTGFYQDKMLSALPIRYKDFSQWQNSEGEKERLKQQELYWLREFAGQLPVLNLPADYPRPVFQSFAGDTVIFQVGPGETRRLHQLCLEHNTTLFMLLLAIFNVLLSKLSSQADIVIGTPIAGRRHADLEK